MLEVVAALGGASMMFFKISKRVGIVCTPPPSLGDGVGGLSHFSECLYRRDLGKIGILGGN